MIRTESVIQSWKATRADSATAVEEFPADAFDFAPAEGLMTFRQIARHILEAGNALAGVLLDGEENLSLPATREKFKQYSSGLPDDVGGMELAAAMRDSIDRLGKELEAKPPAFYEHVITSITGASVTRLEMLQFTKEHELTHRSQLFMYLRLKGIVPPTTRRRLAKK